MNIKNQNSYVMGSASLKIASQFDSTLLTAAIGTTHEPHLGADYDFLGAEDTWTYAPCTHYPAM